MRLKHAKKNQIKKVTRLFGEKVEVEGVLELPSGEKFIHLFEVDESDEDWGFPIAGVSVFAVPTSLLGEKELELREMPRVYLSVHPTDVGSNGYLFKQVVLNHVAQTYPESELNSLFCIELDAIHMADHRSKGLGSYLLPWALGACHEACMETYSDDYDIEDTVITHIFGEVVPDEDDRLEDVNRFYRRNGFREAYGFIYRMIY